MIYIREGNYEEEEIVEEELILVEDPEGKFFRWFFWDLIECVR